MEKKLFETETFDPKIRIGIAAHDAGGAEVLSSFLWKTKASFKALLGGPAVKIFNKKVGGGRVLNLDDLTKDIDILITGTSYPDSLEWQAIKFAKQEKKAVVTFLDSYINYRIRFIRAGQLMVPDTILVTDDYAYNIAKKDLPEFNIIKVNNYHKEYIISHSKKNKMSNLKSQRKKNILYVTEPTSKHALKLHGDENYWGFNEFTALDFFIQNLSNINLEVDSLIIKPHPSEDSKKYLSYCKNYDFVQIDNNKNLVELIDNSNIVVGCSSMALLTAIWLKKKVFSSIPPNCGGFYLPTDNIIFVRDLIEANDE